MLSVIKARKMCLAVAGICGPLVENLGRLSGASSIKKYYLVIFALNLSDTHNKGLSKATGDGNRSRVRWI